MKQGVEDRLNERYLVADFLADQFQASQLTSQRALPRVEHWQMAPIVWALDHTAEVLAGPLVVAKVAGLRTPILHAEAAGRRDSDEVKVVLVLEDEMRAGQVLGPLVVAGPVPPEGDGDTVHLVATDGRLESLLPGHLGHSIRSLGIAPPGLCGLSRDRTVVAHCGRSRGPRVLSTRSCRAVPPEPGA